MTTLNFGIVGAGAISRSSCGNILSHSDARLVAVADSSPSRAGELAQHFDIPRRYNDAHELFRDDGVDAVYIAVPTVLHAPLAVAALEAGKHVLLDKPFATDLAAAESIAAAARDSGRCFMVGMNQRFEPRVQKLKSLIAAGALGEVYHARAYWLRRAGIPRIGSWFGVRALSGGGALLDIGVHMLDAALYALGNFRAVSVSGVARTGFGHRGLGDGHWGLSEREHAVFDTEDFAAAFVRLEGGVTLILEAQWAGHQQESDRMEIEMLGSDAGAAAYADCLFHYGEDGEYHVVRTHANGDRLNHPHGCRFHHFIDAVFGREPLAVTLDEALAVQRILDAVYTSSHEGREVNILPGNIR